MEIREVLMQSIAEPAKVKLIRGSKGTYQWEISFAGETMAKVITVIRSTDDILKETFVLPGGQKNEHTE